ncbi:MAG: head-tail adaptor [Hafnia sp.]|uniref:head-tail adaptor n=1 Tax=Lelliottia amnigena TaxID=61646 RepID=UPI003052809A
MPLLDVSEVLLDPDFMDTTLICHRQIQTVDADNFPTNSQQDIPFSGVVTVDRSLEAKRIAAGQTIGGAILIVTGFRLTQGQVATGTTEDLDADVVTYNGRNYRVTFVDPYTSYGAGFVQAHCELVEFNGGQPVEQ